jgi:hypothetical protein
MKSLTGRARAWQPARRKDRAKRGELLGGLALIAVGVAVASGIV